MGSAQSSNVADAVAKIANSVSSNTSTTNSQVNDIRNSVKLNKCNIGGDVNVKVTDSFIAKNRQIVAAMQQTHIQNSIAQQMQQKAQSTVGALGVGFSDASNYVSTYASATNKVVNMVHTLSTQASFNDVEVVCDDSTVGGNFNINMSNTVNFWNDQSVKSDQVADIANSITQKISQTATAKVEGLGGFLIGLIAIIGAVIYAIAAPVGESISSSKICIAVFMIFGLTFLIIWLWLIQWSPFFSPLRTCSVSGTLLKDQCTPENCKVTDESPNTVNIDHPPLRYMYGLIARGAPRSDNAYGMLNMMIARGGGSAVKQSVNTYNQGFNAAKYLSFADKSNWDLWNGDTTYAKYGVPQLPNPLRISTGTYKFDANKDAEECVYRIPPQYITQQSDKPSEDDDAGSMTPLVYEANDSIYPFRKTSYDTAVSNNDYNLLQDIVAIVNDRGWSKYFETGDISKNSKRLSHARFVLALNLGMDVNVYVDDDEEVMVGTKSGIASNMKGTCYQFSNFRAPLDMSYGIKGSGTLTGVVGICDNRTNNVIKFFSNGGNYMMMVLLLIVMGVVVWFSMRMKK